MADGGFNKLERKILKRKCQKGREHSWNKKQAKINSEEMNVTPFQATLDTPPPRPSQQERAATLCHRRRALR